jgi:hypothetical protein
MLPHRSTLTRTSCLALLALASVPAANAQQLYKPRAVKQAYENGTRSPDGRPGEKYWQNHGRYTITVTALPPDRTVRGTERIVYFNNSPDTLKALNLKLFLNIHKPGAPRAGGADSLYLTPGVTVSSFTVNGQSVPFRNANTFTNHRVTLPAPLAPHDSLTLGVDWNYEISLESGREGMIDSTTWFLAYFYPRVAVYDDYNGWDTMEFTDAQEFYSDFNDYDVTVKVPSNFAVWGTGTLVNADEVLQPSVLQRFRASFSSDTTIRVATRADFAAKSVTAAGPVNSWHFRARNVPDMAFNLSDHYDWDAGSVVVDNATNRRASVQAAYNDTAADYHHMVRFASHALDWLSHNWPGVPYPYEKTTVVQGFAGMEYPMMANDESYPDTVFSAFVAEHEIAHTYFPFYMGINETRYGFMDEGWATTFEYLINVAKLGEARATDFYKQFRVNGWINDPSPFEDLPIITPGDELRRGYGNNAYGKPSLGYLALKDLLGDATFKRALHGFMDRWHGKHPIPWDFFNTVNNVTGRDLNWFFKAWYFDNSYIDIAVRGVARSANGYRVTLENIGGMPAPVDIVVGYADGSSQTFHQTPAIWQSNLQKAVVTVPARKTVANVKLDHAIWVDADTANDGWKR